MKKQVYNPYLPEGEYIPDGEPHLFGDRVYVYGSHDRFGAPIFCVNDYVCYSAPADDLSDWRYEGVIYQKKQDPKSMLGLRLLFAPDVCIGPDGRYYLYYAYDMMGIMGVAVADSPVGPFAYLGHVHYADGMIWGRKKGDSFPFDPGVLVDDDGRVYLFSGFYSKMPAMITGGVQLNFDGGYVLELEQDMVTIKVPEKLLFPKQGPGSFENHEFFEASSIRKIHGKYYFVYSSRHNHELCYAVSDRPTEGYAYGGTLVSIGDLFLDGNEDECHAKNYLGNTHGGILCLPDDEYYIFYHRQTNKTSYARQACAERLTFDRNGEAGGTLHFHQAEITSCGLNGGPLKAEGTYPAYIACNLWAGGHETGRVDGPHGKQGLPGHPYFTQSGKDGAAIPEEYIADMRDGATAGFKYFDLKKAADAGAETENVSNRTIEITVRGNAFGRMLVCADEACKDVLAEIEIVCSNKEKWTSCEARMQVNADRADAGRLSLYFNFRGEGSVDFKKFILG